MSAATRARDAEIVRLFKEGLSDEEIGQKVYLEAGSVQHIRNRMGLKRSMGKKPQQIDDLAELETLFREGKTDQELSEHFGVTVSAIKRIRSKAGIIFSHTGGARPVDREWLFRAFEEASPKTQEEISRFAKRAALDAEVHVSTIRRALREADLIPNFRHAIPAKKMNEAKGLLENGIPYREVANMVGVSKDTLRTHYPGLGVRPQDHWAYVAAKKLERQLGISA